MLNILNPCINYVTKCKPISVPLMLVKFLLKDVIIYAEPKFFPLPTFPSLTSSISLNSLEPLLEKAEEAHARARAHTRAHTQTKCRGNNRNLRVKGVLRYNPRTETREEKNTERLIC